MFRLFKQGNAAKLIIAITTSQFSTGAKFTASSITATFYKLNGTNDDLELDTGIGASGVVTLTADKLGKIGWHTALVDFSAVTAKQYVVVYEATVDSVDAIAEEILDVSAELARLALCALETTSQDILAQVTGTGNRVVPIHVQDTGGNPLQDVLIRIGDASKTTEVDGDTSAFALNDGDYDVIPRKEFVIFTVPTPITVSGDGTHTIVGTVVVPSAPTQPGTCVVYGVVIDSSGAVVEGAGISIKETNDATFSNTQKIVMDTETTSDANGFWELEKIRSSELDPDTSSYEAIITYGDTGFRFVTSITVPDADSVEFSTIVNT